MIEFEINSIPEAGADAPEPDFEPIFLQLKTIVTSAKRQLGRQEIDNHEKEERTLNLDAANIAALPDLPSETPLSRAVSPPFTFLDASSCDVHLHALSGPIYLHSLCPWDQGTPCYRRQTRWR